MTTSRIDRALVTGASAGIGAEFARQLAARGVDLVLVARRREALEALASRLRGDHGVGVDVLPADLATSSGRAAVEDRLRAGHEAVRLLVNNAGFGAYGPFADLDLDRQHELLEVNIVAVTRLTHVALERLRPIGAGGVINVASTASFQPDPFGAVYGASKSFVRSFTEAVHEELAGTGIRAMALCPGFTSTEFQDVAGVRSGAMPSVAVSTPADVVERGLADFTRGRAASVPGALNRISAAGAQVSPSRLTRRISGLLHDRWT